MCICLLHPPSLHDMHAMFVPVCLCACVYGFYLVSCLYVVVVVRSSSCYYCEGCRGRGVEWKRGEGHARILCVCVCAHPTYNTHILMFSLFAKKEDRRSKREEEREVDQTKTKGNVRACIYGVCKYVCTCVCMCVPLHLRMHVYVVH